MHFRAKHDARMTAFLEFSINPRHHTLRHPALDAGSMLLPGEIPLTHRRRPRIECGVTEGVADGFVVTDQITTEVTVCVSIIPCPFFVEGPNLFKTDQSVEFLEVEHGHVRAFIGALMLQV